ncbi:hypothetical protein HK100_001027 [Physocladia obscura]|uniref:Uncharacterized protein n=1 Tax=Physocladia obscura TaxID=109957 RepID=A0AAD5SYG3_9FUNG|nr:hypothetical protein HK100_001027 [Physocladia obscura]
MIAPSDANSTTNDLSLRGVTDVISCFAVINVHLDRLIYCLAGILFNSASPEPFGGPKSFPRYWTYEGTTLSALIKFIINSAYRAYWGWKGRFGLDAVVSAVNRVLELHNETGRFKSLADELVLRGMDRSNHVECRKVSIIPAPLQFFGTTDNAEDLNVVYFSARDIRRNIDSE